LNDLGVLDLTIQRIVPDSNGTTKRKSYIHHREHQVTAVMNSSLQGSKRRVAGRKQNDRWHSGVMFIRFIKKSASETRVG
jgi:hypothetical protein